MVTKKYSISSEIHDRRAFSTYEFEIGEFIAKFDDKKKGQVDIYRVAHCTCIFPKHNEIIINARTDEQISTGLSLLEKSALNNGFRIKLEEIK